MGCHFIGLCVYALYVTILRSIKEICSPGV